MSEDYENVLEEEPEENVLTQEEHLESILFQFVTLYGRWSKDRKVAAKQGADIEKFIKTFAAEVERFSKLEDYTIAKLKRGLEQTTESISTMVHDGVSHSVNKALDGSAGKIHDAARRAESMLTQYQSSLDWSHWKMIAVTAFSSIAVSFLIAKFLMPAPTLPLTDKQMNTYRSGQVLESFWDKISLKEQKRLGNLALGKTNNRQKMVEAADGTSE